MSARTGGLQALEKLIDGAPHNIRDGSVLHAISAWHIYPNMLVFSVDKSTVCTDVLQHDELVHEGGTISVGSSRIEQGDLKAKDPQDSGIDWFMPLDRLRHYDKSVRRTRNLLGYGRRKSFTDLLQVKLGAILAKLVVPQRPWLEYIKMIANITSFSAPAQPSRSVEWLSVILDPSLECLQDTVKGDALLIWVRAAQNSYMSMFKVTAFSGFKESRQCNPYWTGRRR